MADIINIKNEKGEVQYPITKPECVIDENGKNVRQELTELSAEVSELSESVDALGEGGSDVFVAVKNETTYEEIVAAKEAGKAVVCYGSSNAYILSFVTSSSAFFYSHYATFVYELICNKGSAIWSSSTKNNEHELKTLDNGNAKITIAGQSAEVATPQYVENAIQQSGTPSGDPMHYMFEAVGATYNATDADIPMVGIYGDSYVHKARHWHLNELGDITNEEMREIYAVSFPMQRRNNLDSVFANTDIRTNIPIWKKMDTSAYGSASSTAASLFGLGCDCSLEVFAWIVDSGTLMNIAKNLNISTVSCLFDYRTKPSKIKKVLGEINLTKITSAPFMFQRCTSIEEVRLYKLGADLDMKGAALLSYASIKFMLTHSAATSKKTLTLHATALANAEAAYLADAEQDLATYPTLSDWALSKNIQIATA